MTETMTKDEIEFRRLEGYRMHMEFMNPMRQQMATKIRWPGTSGRVAAPR